MTAPTTPGAVHPEASRHVSGAAPGLTRCLAAAVVGYYAPVAWWAT